MTNYETPLKLRIAELIGKEKPFVWAKRMGLSAPTFNRIWNKGGQLKSDYAALIIEKTGVSGTWLITGEGPMYTERPGAQGKAEEAVNEHPRSYTPSPEMGSPEGSHDEMVPISVSKDLVTIVEAVIEVMTSNDTDTKLALSQNVFTFQRTVRNEKEITELKKDMAAIKRRLFADPREDDFKTQEQQRGEQRMGGPKD